jgi:hypothetical protein
MSFSTLMPGGALSPIYRHYTFPGQSRHTQYALVEDQGRTVLQALARGSASGIIRELRVDLRSHPVLAWRWKALRMLERSNLSSRAGDDFVARLYVTFELNPERLSAGDRMQLQLARLIYGADVPAAALCYVWDARAAAGTIAPSAYTDRVRIVVVDSGPANLGRWVQRERNVTEDFARAFGGEPPPVNGIIVSTDTDNTGETAESFFGDVEFRAA